MGRTNRCLWVLIVFGLFAGRAAPGEVPVLLPGSALSGSPLSPDHPYFPNGYGVVRFLRCGEQTESAGAGGPRIALTRGTGRTLPGLPEPLAHVASDLERVEFTVTGMDSDGDYVLGFTWWGGDGQQRLQSVQFRAGGNGAWETVLPATVPLAFLGDQPTWARVLLPIPAAVCATGTVDVAFVRDEGPDAVVSEVWLLKRHDAAPRTRVLIVTGDDWAGHLWRETGPELARILREDPRLEVSITESPAILGSPLINHYEAVLIHFKNYAQRLPLGRDVTEGLERYVQSGHGVVIVHFGCGAFEEWPGYVQIAGRVWDPQKRGHDPYGPFCVRVVDTSDAITRGMEPFDVTDELYTCLTGATPIHVLCEATSKVDGQVYPMAFVVPGNGRVFHCTLGHDVAALRCPGTRALYRRATAWAAGLAPHDEPAQGS